uniref:Uncharacterized protein n=1 Tax=Oryza brachyantha TaxID=4533 RepID=J3MRK0_ORYBR
MASIGEVFFGIGFLEGWHDAVGRGAGGVVHVEPYAVVGEGEPELGLLRGGAGPLCFIGILQEFRENSSIPPVFL